MTNTQARTRAGTFEGKDLGGCVAFLGIPYAEPPVGKLRFRPPKKPSPTRRTYDAGMFRDSCLQPPSEFLPQMGPTGMSEDCLYLNIWTPSADGGGRPVMVWIHGGAFISGSGAFPWYDGARLQAHGVVVVTVNYRLGPFGFLHLPALLGESHADCANLGLQDQIAAVRWVKDQIDEFGGDPDNITIFGESAGAMSVGALLAAQQARGLFKQAIAQSGAAHNALPPDVGARIAERFASSFEAITGRSANSSALVEAPAQVVLEAAMDTIAAITDSGSATNAESMVAGPETLLPFQPVVDGVFLDTRPIDGIRNGAAAGIPLITGTTRDECMLFTVFDRGFQSLTRDRALARIERVITTSKELGLAGSPKESGSGIGADELYDAYRDRLEDQGRPAEPKHVWSAVLTDSIFRIPAIRLAEAQSAHAPAFLYLFTWESPAANGMFGSCHALDIPFVFGNIDDPIAKFFCGEGDGVADLSSEMSANWAEFARAGTPESEGIGSWPAYNPEAAGTEKRALVEFGPTVRITDDIEAGKLPLWEGIL